MERRTTKDIVESIRRGTRYLYRDELKYKRADFIAPFNIDRVEYAVFQGDVEPEDFYLMALVYEACYATPEFLYFRIKTGLGRNERACVEIDKAGLLDGMGALNRRMERLASLGFFFCHEALAAGATKKDRIYYCTMEGFRAFTHRLEKRMSYNRTLIYRPMHDVFRFLATNVALYALYKNPNFRKLWHYEMFDLKKPGEKKTVQEEVYGRILFQKPDSNHKVYVIVEPVYFRCDTTYVTDEDNRAYIAERLGKVRQIVETFNETEDTEAYALILVEDAVGMKKLQDFIATQDLSFYVKSCVYTSENTVFDASMKGGDGTDSMLGLAVKDGEIKFKQRTLPGSI